jgi:hypothetical protein
VGKGGYAASPRNGTGEICYLETKLLNTFGTREASKTKNRNQLKNCKFSLPRFLKDH